MTVYSDRAPDLNGERGSALRRGGWDWLVQSFGPHPKTGEEVFMLETVHKGQHSLDMELEVCRSLGRRAEVFPVSDWAREQMTADGTSP